MRLAPSGPVWSEIDCPPPKFSTASVRRKPSRNWDKSEFSTQSLASSQFIEGAANDWNESSVFSRLEIAASGNLRRTAGKPMKPMKPMKQQRG
jgi:hypothetical protein